MGENTGRCKPSLVAAVVGMAAQHRRGTIELLCQHDANQEMWPGRSAKGERQIGARLDRPAEPVGAADNESDVGLRGNLPVADLCGQGFDGQIATVFVEGDDNRLPG
mgnify:CR=1 FL=1